MDFQHEFSAFFYDSEVLCKIHRYFFICVMSLLHLIKLISISLTKDVTTYNVVHIFLIVVEFQLESSIEQNFM